VAHVQIRDRNLWGSVKTLAPFSRTTSADGDGKKKGKQQFADDGPLTRFTLVLTMF
jgi:hypothetical protein